MTVDDVDPSLGPLPSVPVPAKSTSPESTKPEQSFSETLQTPGYTNPDPASDSSIDWSSSYHGLATTAFEPRVASILMAPIDPEDIEVKPDGIAYLPEIKYRRILNQAFGPGGWGLAPRGDLSVGDKVVTREYALVVGGRYVYLSLSLLSSPVDTYANQLPLNQIRSPSPRRMRLLQRRHHPHGRGGLQVQCPVALLQGSRDSVGALGPTVPKGVQEEALPRDLGRARGQQEEEADLDEEGCRSRLSLCSCQVDGR